MFTIKKDGKYAFREGASLNYKPTDVNLDFLFSAYKEVTGAFFISAALDSCNMNAFRILVCMHSTFQENKSVCQRIENIYNKKINAC